MLELGRRGLLFAIVGAFFGPSRRPHCWMARGGAGYAALQAPDDGAHSQFLANDYQELDSNSRDRVRE